jgi:hypothetical protein
MKFDLARKIADTVLYEGYLLYPYRLSSAKNQFRWQFGIVAPPGWEGEPAAIQTECLFEPHESPRLDITLRFLQVEGNRGLERTVDLKSISLDEFNQPFAMPPLSGFIRVRAERIGPLVKLRIQVENTVDGSFRDRAHAIEHSLVGAHTLLAISGGAFISVIDPPPEAKAAAASCRNLHTWPVLVGREGSRDVMLSAPIILQDYPAIAPESQGDFFDGTEIDEMLTLRVMTLTDEEKQEASADERARRIIERCESIPPQTFERLHGAIRSMEDFFNPESEQPDTAVLDIGDRRVSKGSRVRLTPRRQADSMDLFLAGRTARVQAVHHDVEDRVYVAVTVEDDPAADLHGRYGRHYFFYPDELEPLEGKET